MATIVDKVDIDTKLSKVVGGSGASIFVSEGITAGMDSSAYKLDLTTDEEEIVATLITILRRLQHGSVQMIVQDNRVIQIDTVEKLRIKPRTQGK